METQELELHGLIQDMSNADYHSAPGISKTQLDTAAISGLAYWDAHVNPDREPREEKHCFAVGDGTHKLVLEPGTFTMTYAVGFDRAAHPDALDTVAELVAELKARNMMISGTKPILAARLVEESDFPASRIMLMLEKHHNAGMAGKIPISARSYKDMLGMLKAVNSHHTAGPLLEGAFVEQSYFVTVSLREALGPYYNEAQHGEGVVLLKCRTDAITANLLIVPDLKTTDDVSESAFGRTIAQRRYHVQAAYYLDILNWLYGADAPRVWCNVAAQNRRPYDVAVHWYSDEIIEAGRRLYQRDLANIIDWQRQNYWPGADNGQVIQARLPGWALQGEEAF